MTPGDLLGTHVRACEWTERDDEDDSEMSVEDEDEDSTPEESEVEQTAGASHGVTQTSPVARSTPLHGTLLCWDTPRSRVALRV